MANEGDIADISSELFLNVSIAAARNAPVNSPKAVGACLYCEKELDHPQRWCDKFCRDDWEDEQKAERRAKGGQTMPYNPVSND